MNEKTREDLVSEIGDLHTAADAHARDMDALFLTMTDPVVVYDLQTQIVRCNAAFREIIATYSHDPTGVTLQDRADGLAMHDAQGVVLPNAQWPQNRMLAGEVITDADPAQILTRGPGGIEGYFSVTGSPLYRHDALVGAVVLFHDTTAQHGLAGDLRRSRDDQQAIIDAVPDAVAVFDRDLHLVQSNAAHRATLRRFLPHDGPIELPERAQATNAVYLDAAGAPAPQDQWPHQRILRGETLSGSTAMESRATTLQGEKQWWRVTGAPLRAEDGSITGAVVVSTDITAHKRAEEALQRTNERFRLAERASNGFVYEWNPEDGICYRSEGFERLLGYRPEEIAPTWAAWAQLVYPGDWQVTTDAEALAYLEALPGETLESDYRVRHRDGHYLTVAEHALIERDQAGHVTRLIGQIHDITERKRAEEALQQAHDELEQRVAERTRQLADANRQLRRLSQRILEIQESERRLIARELHDEIGQQLTGAKMLLESLDMQLQETHERSAGKPAANGAETVAAESLGEQEPSLREDLRAARGLVGETLEDVRMLSLELRPAVLDHLGLVAALQWLFERYTQQTGVHVDFASDRLEQRLPQQLEAVAYRIVQEALTNVARYAHVAQVTVQLYLTEETLSLYVVDAGSGFDAEDTLTTGDSTGLGSMRERAELVGGTLTIDSLPGEGTTIHAALPIIQIMATEAAQEVDQDGQEGQEPLDEVARNRARDELRDRARDPWRDARRDAKRDTSRDWLRDASRDTSRDTSRDAARDADRDKVRDTARDTDRDASRDQTRDQARDTARDAAHDALPQQPREDEP